MEKEIKEQSVGILESTLFHEQDSIFHEKNSAAEFKGSKPGQNSEKIDKTTAEGKGYISDFFEGNNDVKSVNEKESSDLEKNPKQAFDQFKVKPAAENEASTSALSEKRRPSAEEIAKNWQDLGVQRCPNCKFTTDNLELFKNHCTTCPSVRSTGRITLTYTNGEFKCNVCDDAWKNKAEFEEHIVCHLQDSPYICLTCQNKRFPSRQQIELHTKNEHPNGDARCGLKGMKNARKYSEELVMQSGTISIQGKLSIPKTPHNHSNQIKSSKEKLSNENELNGPKNVDVISSSASIQIVSICSQNNPISPAVVSPLQSNVKPVISSSTSRVQGSTVHHRPVVVNVINPVQPQSVLATVSDNDTDSCSSRPMPPARTSINLLPSPTNSHLYTSKGGTLVRVSPGEQAKSKHLDSLFGELNRTTNVMQPTFISQKIKDIANPSAAEPDRTERETSSKPIQYHLKTITEYTCTQSTSTISPAVSSMPHQNVFLIPVGQAGQSVLQPQGQILSNTGILYQSPSNSGVFVPIQPRAIGSVVTGASIRIQQAPIVTAVPPNLQVNQVPQNTVVQTTVSAPSVRSQNSATGNTQYVTQAGVGNVQSVASSSRAMPPLQQAPGTRINQPPSYKEAIADKHSTVSSSNPQVFTIRSAPTGDITKIPKKYLFKIKPGQGFVCEACKKFTRDECVFRRHVWEHFHGTPVACKTCSSDFIARKIVLECKLVSNIVCNLIKQSLQEVQETSKPLKVLKVGENEVIDITEDEDDKNESKQQRVQDHATEVIVLDDEDENGVGQGLQIRISNTYSLSSVQNLDLEQMPKKDKEQNDEGKSPEEKSEDDKHDVHNEVPKSSILVRLIKGDQERSPASSVTGESQQTVSESRKTDSSSGQKHPNSYMGLNEIENDGERSDAVKQIPASGEGDEDEDGKIKGTNLLDKSLSEPGNDSEEIVSQVLETNLKDYDPTKNTAEEPLCDEPNCEEAKVKLNLSGVTTKTHETEGASNTGDANLDHVNVKGKTAFESEILSKQSHNAFYVCGYENCVFTGMTSSKYREHIQSEQHANEYNYVCGHCGQKDYTEDTHVRHIFSHANSKTFLLYKCPIRLCKYKTNLLHMYADHLHAHPNEELIVKCVYCHKTFPSIDSLKKHLKHNLLKFVICPYCSFKFVNKHVVMTHIRLFHPDKSRMVSVTSQVVCNEREINFYVAPKSKALIQPDQLEKDIADSENIDIPALLNDFQKENAAKEKTAHEQTEHGKGSENGDADDVLSLPEEDQGDFKEKQTKEQIDNQNNSYSRRLSKVKGRSDTITKGGPKSLECPRCSYLSYNQSLYAKHLSLHDTEPEREKRFVCNLCPKGADSLPHFKTHVKNHVGKHVIKVYCCTTCAYCSNQKCHIMDHVQDAHVEETLYTLKEEVVESNHFECSYCAFKARISEQVAAHEKNVHRIDSTLAFKNDTDNMAEEKTDQTTENSPSLQKSSASKTETGTSINESETVARKKKYKYHCEYCSEFFKHKSNLKEHMINDHRDIENKQFIFFKCKYCIYTSTMKDMIIGHLEKDHSGLDLRILRKIEVVENDQSDKVKGSQNVEMAENDVRSTLEKMNDEKSNNTKDVSDSDKIEVVIPDGNVFKQMFSCPKCSFTTNMRIKAMKHLKEHPEVKPIRPDQRKTPSKPTARKSCSSALPKVDLSKKKSSLIQQLPQSAEPLKNPFTAVKESVVSKDSRSSDGKMMLNSPSKDAYILGEQRLHTALSACFIPFEKDMKFQCRICKQKIFKKFVLHRHILDHLKIVFFKCTFCDEGSIERTLMVGHIQKEHPSKAVLYDSVEKSVLEKQLKERIFSQDFNDTLDISTSAGSQGNAIDEVKNIAIVKKAVHEYQTIDDDSDDDGLEEPVNESEEAGRENSLKCPKCRYVARSRHILNLHMQSHNDPMKTFTCSVCDYRGDKSSVLKHVYSVYHLAQAKVVENGIPLNENLNSQREKDSVIADKSKNEGKTMLPHVSKKEESESLDSKNITNSQGKQIKKDSIVVSKSYQFEMKTSYKCKECGEKRDSKSGMYHHFKTSKCNKPVLKCSLCSFQNTVKVAIHRHAAKRHPGKKISVLDLPLSAKMKVLKIPLRQGRSIIKGAELRDNEDTAESSHTEMESTSDGGQIRCQLCTNYLCESTMKLQFHVNTAHHGAMLYCQECSYKSPLVKHMINHCTNLHYQKVAIYGKEPRSVTKKKDAGVDVNQEKVLKTISSTDNKIVFRCPKCDLELSTISSVQTHLFVHFNYKPYCCKYCGKRLARIDHVKKHTESIHEGKVIKYDMKKDEAIELKVKKMYDTVKRNVVKQRIMLGKNRPSMLDKMELVEEGIRKKEKLFYCDFCHYHSDRRATVRNHVSNVHAGISRKRPLEIDSDTDSPSRKIFKKGDDSSDVASTISSSIDEEEDETVQKGDELPLLKYKVVKSPNGKKQFKCSDCDYVNKKIKNLKRHLLKNHGSTLLGKKENAFKCFYCSYGSVHQSSDMYLHFKTHHPSKKIVKFFNKSGEVVTRDVFQTNIKKSPSSSLGRSSPLSSPARSHTESVQSEYSPVKPVKRKNTGVTNYNCDLCSYSGIGFFHFRLHLITHEEFTQLTPELDVESKMSCGFCSYLGKNTFDLSVHIASHMAEMRYKCAYCDYSQFSSCKVSQHLKYCHADREEIVFDRELRKASNGMIKLVNFNPVLEIDQAETMTRKRKYKRIMIETDESSNSSSSDNEADNISALESKRTNIPIESMDESVTNNDGLDKNSLEEKSQQIEPVKDSKKEEENAFETSSRDAKSVPEKELADECQKGRKECDRNSNISVDQKCVSEHTGLDETQMFRVESQPFSPSDAKFAEGDDSNESNYGDCKNNGTDNENPSSLSLEFSTGSDENNEVKLSETEKSALSVDVVDSSLSTKLQELQNEKIQNECGVIQNNEKEQGNSSTLYCEFKSTKGSNENIEEKCCETEQSTNPIQVRENSEDKQVFKVVNEIVEHNENISVGGAASNLEITEKKAELKHNKYLETKNSVTNTNYDVNIDNSTINADAGVKQNKFESSELKNNEDNLIPEDRHIGSYSTPRDSTANTIDKNDFENDNISNHLCTELQDEGDNACTSTCTNEELKKKTNEPSKSPRNVFDSISDVSDSLCDTPKPQDCYTSEETVLIENKTEEREDTSNEDQNVNVFEKFASDMAHGDSSHVSLKGKQGENSLEECQDNIFEKIANNSVANSGNHFSEANSAPCSMEVSEKNIFETFGNVNDEISLCGSSQESSDISARNDMTVIDNTSFANPNDTQENASNIQEKLDMGNDSNIFSKFSAEQLEVAGPGVICHSDDEEKSDMNNSNIFAKFSTIEDENKEKVIKNSDEIRDQNNDKNLFEESSYMSANRNIGDILSNPNENADESNIQGKFDFGNDSNIFSKFSAEQLDVAAPDVTDHTEDEEKSDMNNSNIFTLFSNSKKSNEDNTSENTEKIIEEDNDRKLSEESSDTSANKHVSDNPSDSNKTLENVVELNIQEKVDMGNGSNIFSKFSAEQLDVAASDVTGHTEDEDKSDINNSIICTKLSNSKNGNEENINENSDEMIDEENDTSLFEKFGNETLSAGLPESEDKQKGIPKLDLNYTKNSDQKSSEYSEDKSSAEHEKTVEDMEIDELINSIEETVNERKTEQTDNQNDSHEMETD